MTATILAGTGALGSLSHHGLMPFTLSHHGLMPFTLPSRCETPWSLPALESLSQGPGICGAEANQPSVPVAIPTTGCVRPATDQCLRLLHAGLICSAAVPQCCFSSLRLMGLIMHALQFSLRLLCGHWQLLGLDLLARSMVYEKLSVTGHLASQQRLLFLFMDLGGNVSVHGLLNLCC